MLVCGLWDIRIQRRWLAEAEPTSEKALKVVQTNHKDVRDLLGQPKTQYFMRGVHNVRSGRKVWALGGRG